MSFLTYTVQHLLGRFSEQLFSKHERGVSRKEEMVLRDMLLELNDSCEQYGMKVIANKTKSMVIGRKVKKVSVANYNSSVYPVDIGEKWEYKDRVHQLFVDLKKAYDSVKKQILYNTLIEFGIPKKLVRLIKMCHSETYSKVYIGQFLSDAFPIH
ncbi:hypothetical protein ANN_02474 [Periplaneta americana]|uniref:Reverse transcriptase n=1 Tax=Periplaneta americana TaxID=6978 RepID=A0ABQ8TYW5_PERAM|nr:hypothetical protein ANN_02474 [Periplaneta americana]